MDYAAFLDWLYAKAFFCFFFLKGATMYSNLSFIQNKTWLCIIRFQNTRAQALRYNFFQRSLYGRCYLIMLHTKKSSPSHLKTQSGIDCSHTALPSTRRRRASCLRRSRGLRPGLGRWRTSSIGLSSSSADSGISRWSRDRTGQLRVP